MAGGDDLIDVADVQAMQVRIATETGLGGEAARWSAADVAALVRHAGSDAAWLKRALKRRLMGEPLAYVMGGFEFEGRFFVCDARAYVTDPETRWLVRAVLGDIDAHQVRTGRWPVVAEFGFGGGALGITVKLERPGVHLVALDIDGAALAVGRQNLARHGVEATVAESDGFDSWPLPEAPDLIFGDPPWGGETDLYGEGRDAAHYHAMPAASAYPLGGVTAVHRYIMAAVAERGWTSLLILNLGVLPEAEVAVLRGAAAESEVEYAIPSSGVLRAIMVSAMPSGRKLSMNPSLGELNAQNLSAWDALYASTGELIWGEEEVGFLGKLLARERAAGRRFGRTLDAATGEGRNLPALLEVATEVSACDGSAAALTKIAPEVMARVKLAHCELAATPFADNSFDFILVCDTIETLPDPEPVLRELRRVLAPGGCLLCNIPGPEGDVAGTEMTTVGDEGFLYRQRYFYRFFQDDAARQLLAATGWRVIRDDIVAWREAPHPGFRPEEHDHCSRVYLLEAVLEPELHG